MHRLVAVVAVVLHLCAPVAGQERPIYDSARTIMRDLVSQAEDEDKEEDGVNRTMLVVGTLMAVYGAYLITNPGCVLKGQLGEERFYSSGGVSLWAEGFSPVLDENCEVDWKVRVDTYVNGMHTSAEDYTASDLYTRSGLAIDAYHASRGTIDGEENERRVNDGWTWFLAGLVGVAVSPAFDRTGVTVAPTRGGAALSVAVGF